MDNLNTRTNAIGIFMKRVNILGSKDWIMYPQNSYVDAVAANTAVFGDRASKEVISKMRHVDGP